MKRIVILISGRGTNMQALVDARLPAQIGAVVSNDPRAAGLDIARDRGISTHVVNHREYAERSRFDQALAEAIDKEAPDLIVLAGFMRILGDACVMRFNGKLINVHPSLLPAFPGTDTHRRALQEGVKIHGCTVHFVTPRLDGGPIIVQAAVPVLPHDTEAALAARVLKEEHRILPQAVRWFLDGRLSIQGNRVLIAGEQRCSNSLICPLPA